MVHPFPFNFQVFPVKGAGTFAIRFGLMISIPALSVPCCLGVICEALSSFHQHSIVMLPADEENIKMAAAVEAGEPAMQHGESIVEGEDDRGLIPRLLAEMLYELLENTGKGIDFDLIITYLCTLISSFLSLSDIVLYLCERGHVEGGMIFQLLEDLTEVSTMKDCKEVFGYIESKQDILGKQELFGRGKLVMLRTCNQLLRRLSKVLCSVHFPGVYFLIDTHKKHVE
eukprot:Gb_06210 [translate_table: standard]